MGIKVANVVVCVPSTGTWVSHMAKSVMLMTSYFQMHRVPGVKQQKISIINTEGSMLSALRELMTKKALQNHYSHILFIDSDMEFPMDGLNRLLSHNKHFVAANCVTRNFPVEPTAHDLYGNRIDSRGKTGIQEVQHVGLAFALINTSVLKTHMKPPLYLMDWIPPIQNYCGEDVYFCQKLAAAGVKLYIDHDVSQKILHVGTYKYGFKDLEKENGRSIPSAE